MFLRDYLRQLFTAINNGNSQHVKLHANSLSVYLLSPNARFETHITDALLIEYFMETELVDLKQEIQFVFINTDDEEELMGAKPNDARPKLPGCYTIYQVLLEQSAKENCSQIMQEAILSIMDALKKLCAKKNKTSLIDKQLPALTQKQHDLEVERNNQAIQPLQSLEKPVTQNDPVDAHSLPDTYHVLPGFFWMTVDYIAENPGKIMLGVVLTCGLLAGVTLIALGSCGIGLLGLCAMGTAAIGAGLTVASLGGSSALLGYSVFSYPEGKSTLVDEVVSPLNLNSITI